MPTLDLAYPPRAARSRVIVQRGALREIGARTARTTGAARVLIVTDSRVVRLYAPAVQRALGNAGLVATVHVVPAGERSKSGGQLARLWHACAAAQLGRGDVIVALGG